MLLQYFVFVLLFISASGSVDTAATKCPLGSVYRHSTKCYKFHPEISSFDVANLSCSILNGYLARIHDQEENEFLTQQSKLHFKDVQLFDAWIGGSGGNFSLLDSKPLGSKLDLSERYCISLQLVYGYWKANHCEKSTRKPYICEFKLPVNTVASRNSTSPKTISDVTTIPPPATTKQSLATSQNLLTTIPSNPQSINCTSGWLHFNGFCYQKSQIKYSWRSAENFCISHNAHLISIHNDEEYNFVDGFAESQYCYWTGLHTTAKDVKIWEYTDGTIFNFVKFPIPDQKFLDPRLAPCVYSCNHYYSNANRCEAVLYGICKKSVLP